MLQKRSKGEAACREGKTGGERKKVFQKCLFLSLNTSTRTYEKLGVNTIAIKIPKLLQIVEVCTHANSSAEEFMEF